MYACRHVCMCIYVCMYYQHPNNHSGTIINFTLCLQPGRPLLGRENVPGCMLVNVNISNNGRLLITQYLAILGGAYLLHHVQRDL